MSCHITGRTNLCTDSEEIIFPRVQSSQINLDGFGIDKFVTCWFPIAVWPWSAIRVVQIYRKMPLRNTFLSSAIKIGSSYLNSVIDDDVSWWHLTVYIALSFGILGTGLSHFAWKCLQFNQITVNTSSTNFSWLSPKQFDWLIGNFAQTEWSNFTGWGNWGKWFRWFGRRTLSTFVYCCQTDLSESILSIYMILNWETNQKLELPDKCYRQQDVWQGSDGMLPDHHWDESIYWLWLSFFQPNNLNL